MYEEGQITDTKIMTYKARDNLDIVTKSIPINGLPI